MPAREELPSTLRRSPARAQETWSKAHDAAVEQYGEGELSHRTAFAALKHSFEKVGDHWEPKAHPGPGDAPSARWRPGRSEETAEGVDVNAPKAHLTEVARRLEIPGRSRMSKDELVEAIMKVNRSAPRRARSRDR